MSKLSNRSVAFLATDCFEQVELTHPWKALKEQGAKPVLVSIKKGEIQGLNHIDKGDEFSVDCLVSEVNISDFDALVLPGGAMNPDELRTDSTCVQFIADFFNSGKPVAAICHAPWTLVEAGVLKGRTLTSWPSLQTDIQNAGGSWVDQELSIDGNLITSRCPDDLEAFSSAIVNALS